MAKLYVIGNGFDLWHGLPTGYDRFYEFAKEMLDELENYYLLDRTKECRWCDFENSLGTFNWGEFFDAHNHVDVNSESFSARRAH